MNSRTTSDIGDKSTHKSSETQDHLCQQLHSKIKHIQSQIDALPEFMPESHQYLMGQLDHHQQQLLALMLQEEFSMIEATSGSRNDDTH
jgi:hypothetical protein